MLLTITTTHRPANDLGYLLHKHPERFQSFDMSFGKAHVYYPEVGAERCTACLLLDVDSVGLVRGKNADQSFLLAQYVNDRPYTASSFMSVAIAQVFGSALQGRCKDRPELVTTAIPLSARMYVLIPVFDNRKHYWLGDDEMEKLLAKGEGWLAGHPEKEEITRRYLKFQPSLFRMALSRLVQEEEPAEAEDDDAPKEKAEEVLEKPLSLN